MTDLALLVALLITAVCLAMHNRRLADDDPIGLNPGVHTPEPGRQPSH
jgi:hypothetical protein